MWGRERYQIRVPKRVVRGLQDRLSWYLPFFSWSASTPCTVPLRMHLMLISILPRFSPGLSKVMGVFRLGCIITVEGKIRNFFGGTRPSFIGRTVRNRKARRGVEAVRIPERS